jgi:hypothetical protein
MPAKIYIFNDSIFKLQNFVRGTEFRLKNLP